jgi:glycosyl transferase family 87
MQDNTPPSQEMSARRRRNLAIAGLLVFYAIQIIFEAVTSNTFGRFASDFASFWSAGYIANHQGYASVYDLSLMSETQRALLPAAAASLPEFHSIPTPYLPVFILPFQLLALTPPIAAAWFWLVLNLLGTLAYFHLYVRRLNTGPAPRHLLLMLLVSTPVFLNLFTGQVNLILAVCVGEYLLNARAGRPLVSGLWLGGLLLKPQCLILIVPFLLLQRSVKTILGLAASGAALVGISWILGGLGAFGRLVQLWLGYTGGLPTNDPQLMMNWRMVGVQLGLLIPQTYAWVLAMTGMVVTSLAALAMWLRPVRTDSDSFLIAVAATLAATVLVAWHSHVHMAMVLIPPLILLYLSQRNPLGNALEWWVFLPAGLYFLRLILASMMYARILPGQINPLLDLLQGVGLFVMNLYLLGWALHVVRARPMETRGAAGA